METVELSSFTRNTSFYGTLDLVLTVKSFDLQAIRKRYFKSKKNKSNRTGSVERREVGIGGIVTTRIENGQIHMERILARVKEPRGIDFQNRMLAVSTEDEVRIIEEDGAVFHITDPWFSYIHTVSFDADAERVLVSSSGFDLIQEFEIGTRRKTWEWIAWENGFNEGRDPKTGKAIVLSRNPEQPGDVLITDPASQKLPTAMRAAFINSVLYSSDPDSVLATFFHQGKVFEIDRSTGSGIEVAADLITPHGGRTFGKGYLVTSTGSGEVVSIQDGKEIRYSFAGLPGKPSELASMEWIQNSVVLRDLIVSIDANRSCLVIFDPIKKYIDYVPCNPDWAIQDLVVASLSASQIKSVASMDVS